MHLWIRQDRGTDGQDEHPREAESGLIAALVMTGGLGGIFLSGNRQNVVIGTKAIQFVTIVFILPLLLILGLMNVLGRNTIGTLLGVIVGYVLSGFGKESTG